MADLLLTCGTGMRVFYSIMLSLDSAIYWCVDVVYSVFIVICNTQLFSATTFEAFSSRIYAIFGVVMLFIVTSQLLVNIADPDKAASGEASTAKLVQNIIIALISIVLLPTVFKYLYVIQKAVVTENIIGNIIVGGYETSTSKDFKSMVKHSGKDMAFRTFTAFINPAGYAGNNDKGCEAIPGLTYCLIYDKINNYGSSDYGKVSLFASQNQVTNEIYKGKVEYRWGFSALAGILVTYFLLSYSIDMGVRVAKLAYYQLIAPVPIVLRIIPKQQSVFDNWVKGLTGTYIGVFIRLMIVYFCIFLINVIPAAWDGIVKAGGGSDRTIVNAMVVILLIFGVFIFMKEAPKLITQMFGISEGDMSMGIGKKLAGAAVIGGAVAGAQKLGKKYAGKAYGGLTGALGGGWDSMMNGEGFGAGFRAGGLGGWDAGGRQFGKQRLESYKSRTGDYKGKPGIFGDKSWGTKYRNATGDARDDAYKAASTARIQAAQMLAGASYSRFVSDLETEIRSNPAFMNSIAGYAPDVQDAYINREISSRSNATLQNLVSGNDVDRATALSYVRDNLGMSAADINALSSVGKTVAAEAKQQAKVQEEKDNKKVGRILQNVSGGGTPPAAPPAAPPAGGAGGGAAGGGGHP